MLVGTAFLFTPAAARLAKLEGYDPYATFIPAIRFIQNKYPNHRFLNDYELGGVLIATARGTLPVFIDGRGDTAYPAQLVKDYTDILYAAPGWEKLLDTYKIDGIILTSYRSNPILLPRFEQRTGWEKVFSDEAVIIYVRAK